MYYVERYDKGGNTAHPSTLNLIVERYSQIAKGGYEQATIRIEGSESGLWDALLWLGYYVIIRNKRRSAVWAGKITQVTINLGGLQVGLSLDEMKNRVAVAYVKTDADGNTIRYTTDWADNADSVSAYGIKEYLDTQGELDEERATALQARILELQGLPVDADGGVNLGEVGGSILCRGLWDTLGWRLWNNPCGVIRFEGSGGTDHLLGWGMTSNQLAFYKTKGTLADIAGRLKTLKRDDRIVITGAANAANNGTKVIKDTTNLDAKTYTSTTINFDNGDDILDTAGGMAFVQSGELLQISGSGVAGNNRYYFAKEGNASDHIFVTPGSVVTSAPGPNVTLKQGNSIALDTALSTEFPNNSITVSYLGLAISQPFTMEVSTTFTVAEVLIKVKKVGNPIDSLYVAIESEVSGVPSNVALEAVSIAASQIRDRSAWITFNFSNTLALTFGTRYHLVVGRTGASDPANYYVVDIDDSNTYAPGPVKLWTGSAWVDRYEAAYMPFQVWAHRQTTDQMNDILTYANQFFTAIDITQASLTATRQYRDEDKTAKTELEALMNEGTAGGTRYLARVGADRAVHIYPEPAYSADTAPRLTKTGELMDVAGSRLEAGKLPVGQWVTLTGVPANVNAFVNMARKFVERAEWDAQADKLSALEFKGAPNPWDILR